jgi:myo-inositol-1(or 4)-monophosphatase
VGENGEVTTLLSAVLDIAREAAALANDLTRGGVSALATKSTAVDVVTIVDRQVETLIRRRITEQFPGDGIFGEEEAATASSTGRTWVVDPIDGTTNLLYGLPQYGVSIAVVEGDPATWSWTALAGVVINPVTGEEFSAARGEGAFLDGNPIHVTRPASLAQSLLATGFAYDADTRTRQAEVVSRIIARVRDIRRLGACSLDLCALAAGRVDAYFERTLSAWDFAAGALIAEEAGAELRGWGGAAPSRDWMLVAHPDIIDDYERLLVDAGAHFDLK